VRYSLRGKDVAGDIVRIRYQETTSEDRGLYVCCSYIDL
jgi:hypothetical protein